jgi:hypothetical protein
MQSVPIQLVAVPIYFGLYLFYNGLAIGFVLGANGGELFDEPF